MSLHETFLRQKPPGRHWPGTSHAAHGGHLTSHRIALCLALSVAACSTGAPPPKPPPLAQRHAPPDWFHHQLALARHARMTHLPAGDTAGAQRAYYAVMLPACQHVARSGPNAYRARCHALIEHATADAAAADDDFNCMSDEDDSQASQAQKTACDD